MNEEKKYPIAETFTSIQGEGYYGGVVMHFVRIAGCSVGRPIKPDDPMYNPLMPIYTEKCTTYDNRSFYCDTDFRTRNMMTAAELIAQVPKGVRHLCITGGEPMNHDLTSLIRAARGRGMKAHVETSGTVPITKGYPEDETQRQYPNKWNHLWVTVSPKHKVLPEMLYRADEIKILIDENFDMDKVPMQVKDHAMVYIQPINGENSINQNNVDLCHKVLAVRPDWRFSIQLHKVIGVR